MQEQMGKLEEELRQMKQVAHEANIKASNGLSPMKGGELLAELKTLKELHSNTQEELKMKDKNIVSLKVELERAKQFQLKLTEKDASLRTLREELSNAKENEAEAMYLISSFKKKVYELEVEVANRRLSESKIFDSLASQTREFDQTKVELEKSKVEICSLHERIELLEASPERIDRHCNGSCTGKIARSSEKELGYLRFELGLAKANLAMIQEREKIASSKAQTLSNEVRLLRNELKLATEAEEKSQKALDDLALALKEVVKEASVAKEKLSASQLELEHVKEEAVQLKQMVRNTEARYQKLLDEAKKETNVYRETADRLKVEVEESLLVCNEKEMNFTASIKKAEEERTLAQQETARLAESLKAAKHKIRAAKEENNKLRDIMNHALNEANAAKAAAELARDENIQLKDSLAEKEESLHRLTRENERLRIDEVGAHENIKELKQLLSSSSLKTEDKEHEEEKSPVALVEKHYEGPELKLQQNQDDLETKIQDEDPEKAKALKGSISDIYDSPKIEPHTPKPVSHHRRVSSSAFSDNGGTPKTEDSDYSDYNHLDNSDSDRSTSSRRKKKALFRRVGDLIRGKSFHKRQSSANLKCTVFEV